jgi:hypothetical protein
MLYVLLIALFLICTQIVIGHGMLTNLILEVVRVIFMNINHRMFTRQLITNLVLLTLLSVAALYTITDVMAIYDNSCGIREKKKNDVSIV